MLRFRQRSLLEVPMGDSGVLTRREAKGDLFQTSLVLLLVAFARDSFRGFLEDPTRAVCGLDGCRKRLGEGP